MRMFILNNSNFRSFHHKCTITYGVSPICQSWFIALYLFDSLSLYYDGAQNENNTIRETAWAVTDIPMCMIRIIEFWCIYSPLAYTLNPLLSPATDKSRHQKIYMLSNTTNWSTRRDYRQPKCRPPTSFAPLELSASPSHKPKITSGLKPVLRFLLFGAKALERKCLHTFITCPHAKFSTHGND